MKWFSKDERNGLVFLMAILALMSTFAVFIDVVYKGERSKLALHELSQPTKPLHQFDPNTVLLEELLDMGVSASFSYEMIRWRKYGKVYRTVEDLIMVRSATDSLYKAIKPYVVIADSLAPKPRVATSNRASSYNNRVVTNKSSVHEVALAEPFCFDTVSVGYMIRWGFSERQAEVVLRYRDAIGGIRSEKQLRDCYVVDDAMAERLLKYVVFVPSEIVARPDGAEAEESSGAELTLLELNSADSVMLVAVDGIGAKSAHEIVKYRELLGGFHNLEQLSELKSITESNFEKILQQIYCDSCKISKIDINFAGPKELERHPYVSARALRRIIKQRQLKGGWSRIEEMIDDKILSEDEARRLAPYLRFGPRATE